MESMTRRSFLGSVAASVALSARGQLAFSEDVSTAEQSVCRAMATDYGHHIHHMPLGVLFPKSAKDVQKAVRYANSRHLRLAVRGTGGAAYGQSQVKAGIVIDSSPLNHLAWVTADSIDAGPGALWKDCRRVHVDSQHDTAGAARQSLHQRGWNTQCRRNRRNQLSARRAG